MTTRNHRFLARLVRIPVKAARTISVRAADDVLLVHWANRRIIGRNWGDKLNPVLCRMISGMNVVHAYDIFPAVRKPVHFVVGSSLERAQKRRGVVWGAGFIDSSQGVRQEPSKICALRGHHSRERLRELGIAVPDTVGDPAFLMPRLYTPRRTARRYRVGVIAHCYERDIACAGPEALPEDFLSIDITGGIFDVIDQVCACDEIVSSSLHGLVCAEAYGVPSTWIKLSDRPAGDGFKYHDFYSAVGKQQNGPRIVDDPADWPRLAGTSQAPIARDMLDRINNDLLDACPFAPETR